MRLFVILEIRLGKLLNLIINNMSIEIPKENETEEENFKPLHELKDAKNLEEITGWFQQEVDDYTEENRDFMMGYHFEDLIGRLLSYLAQERGINIDGSANVKTESKNTYNEFQEGNTTGSVMLAGKEILKYSSRDDGSAMSIDEWNSENLKQALAGLLEK